jgi:hypothetical protein
MKKKIFNLENLPRYANGSGCSINFNVKGHISFSKELIELLKVKTINFVQDEERPKDWYIEVTKAKGAIEIRDMQNGQFIIQSASFVKTLFESLEYRKIKSARFTVASEAYEKDTYAILTKHPVNQIPEKE